MSDPFNIDGPALVSFSGGRTARMLWEIVKRGLLRFRTLAVNMPAVAR